MLLTLPRNSQFPLVQVTLKSSKRMETSVFDASHQDFSIEVHEGETLDEIEVFAQFMTAGGQLEKGEAITLKEPVKKAAKQPEQQPKDKEKDKDSSSSPPQS